MLSASANMKRQTLLVLFCVQFLWRETFAQASRQNECENVKDGQKYCLKRGYDKTKFSVEHDPLNVYIGHEFHVSLEI